MKCLSALSMMLLVPCLSVMAPAQSTNATISGVVVDPSSNVIPDAAIEILNDGTGVHYSARTNGVGIYTITILPPGQYRVQVSKIGFKTLIKPGIVLNVQSAVVLNFTLPLGASSVSITVEGGASTINTTDGSVSTVIDRKFVEDIPLNGRSFQDLISMTPGVVTQSPQATGSVGQQGDFSVNGQRTESNYYTIDGVSGNISAGPGGTPGPANSGSIGASTALGTTQSLISVDALQEFRVQSSTYSAEYGRSAGGQFAIVTRSGTNDFHGTVFDYLRNNYFDANDWFSGHYGKQISALRQNDFGGTFGGPVLMPRIYDGRDKTFLFASYEGLRLTQPQAAAIQYVPDTYMRHQAPSGLQPILNAFPIQNGMDYGTAEMPSLAQLIAPYSLPSQIDSTSIRMDQVILPKISAFFRMGYTPSSVAARMLSALTNTQFGTQTYTLGITAQLARSINNEFRVGYARSNSELHSTLDSFGGATPTDLGTVMGATSSANLSPGFEMYFPGIGTAALLLTQSGEKLRQWNVIDTLSLAVGRQQIKVGIDWRRIKSPLTPTSPFLFADYGTPQQVLGNDASYTEVSVSDPSTPIFNEAALFVQDEWHISPRFSLSGGIRWEANPPPTEAHGNDAYTVSGNLNDIASLTLAPRGTPLWKTTWFNFAPRLGIAWRIRGKPGWETAFRTGGGIFFDTNHSVATRGFNAVGFSTYQLYFGSPLPLTKQQIRIPVSVTPPYGIVYAFPQHLQQPYTWQWNAAVEQALGKSQSLTLSYIGSNGRRLMQEKILSIASLNPNFSDVAVFQSGATSNYQALQAKFQRSIGHGLQALASYTWSHSIDFGSQNAQIPETRGNSDFDVRQNFQGGLSWDVPLRVSNRIVRAATRDWGLDGRIMARSGFPITLFGNQLVDATGAYYYSGVNIVPNTPVYLYGTQYPGGRALNPAAFVLPSGSETGNAARNFLRGFGAGQLNVAVRRNFRLGDKVALQFRAETFNIANHPNFGYLDPYLYDATFGQATQMLNESLGTVASQYQQGGPRSMQFALKITF